MAKRSGRRSFSGSGVGGTISRIASGSLSTTASLSLARAQLATGRAIRHGVQRRHQTRCAVAHARYGGGPAGRRLERAVGDALAPPEEFGEGAGQRAPDECGQRKGGATPDGMAQRGGQRGARQRLVIDHIVQSGGRTVEGRHDRARGVIDPQRRGISPRRAGQRGDPPAHQRQLLARRRHRGAVQAPQAQGASPPPRRR